MRTLHLNELAVKPLSFNNAVQVRYCLFKDDALFQDYTTLESAKYMQKTMDPDLKVYAIAYIKGQPYSLIGELE